MPTCSTFAFFIKGLMFGPAFNLFLRKMNFKLFDRFQCDRKSSPGLFMSIIWSLCFLIFLALYSSKENSKSTKQSTYEVEQENKKSLLSPSIEQQGANKPKRCTNFKMYKQEFLRLEIVIILLVTFFTYFNQTSLETIVIPFTESYFAWNELHNSILFCIGGGIIILSYIIVRLISIRWSDKAALFFGIFFIFPMICEKRDPIEIVFFPTKV
jgi:Na+/melibiose symporter-like transporter